MKRPREDQAEAPGQDSFLDVVANLVGILIILVMVVGAQAGRGLSAREATQHSTPSPATDSVNATSAAEVARAEAAATSVEVSISELDARIPIGTVIPGVILGGEFSGDRADVRSAARWASGLWALEVKRRLETTSEFDVPIRSGVHMRVAAFDHSQIRHTRHVRPIRIEVDK